MPTISPATGLRNHLYDWKHGQNLRYQVTGPANGQAIVLVHGLFSNADHWRKTLTQFSKEEEGQHYRVYAVDLWGCGYSSKPAATSVEAMAVNGERRRFGNGDASAAVYDVSLSTANGQSVRSRTVPLQHSTGSPYNFYTWSDCLTDFCRDIVQQPAVIVGNSAGTIAALQAATDEPDLFAGVMLVTPTFREMHVAEQSPFLQPLTAAVQKLLQRFGHGLFRRAANAETVRKLLLEPYHVKDAVDDVLIQSLLDPLLTVGAAEVVLDTLAYSTGPLPEQLLETFPLEIPVWIGYGERDPWTPAARVQALQRHAAVEIVQGWTDVGHAPHDENPHAVHAMLTSFMEKAARTRATACVAASQSKAK